MVEFDKEYYLMKIKKDEFATHPLPILINTPRVID